MSISSSVVCIDEAERNKDTLHLQILRRECGLRECAVVLLLTVCRHKGRIIFDFLESRGVDDAIDCRQRSLNRILNRAIGMCRWAVFVFGVSCLAWEFKIKDLTPTMQQPNNARGDIRNASL